MNAHTTLNQFLIHHLTDHPENRELVLIMSDLSTIGKYLSYKINKAGISDIFGETGTQNATGDSVKKLDRIANEFCREYLEKTKHFAALASEEEEGIVELNNVYESANHIIAFDPIDGSSNIDVNIPIGTIFSIHKVRKNIPRNAREQFYQKGRDLVGAGYILYGTSTVFVFSFGDSVYEFTLDQGLGEFLLSREKIKVPPKCTIYSVNESNIKYMRDSDRNFVKILQNNNNYTARYIGSLVADFHRNLIKGGIFFYPEIDQQNQGVYKPKLRLIHEAQALAFIIEHAGGQATDGKQHILDMIPTALHQRTALLIGNKII